MLAFLDKGGVCSLLRGKVSVGAKLHECGGLYTRLSAGKAALFRPSPQQIPVDQPIDLFVNGPVHTTFLHVSISAMPVAPLVSLLFNRPQDNYARESRT
jgi:hypothetical protein